MKLLNTISKSLLVGLSLIITMSLHAQDAKEYIHNSTKKVILENNRVKVTEVVIAPGEVSPWHSHPDFVVYVISGGKIEDTAKGKRAELRNLKEGEAYFYKAVTHMTKNVGTTTIKLIVTDIMPASAAPASGNQNSGRK